MIVSIFVLKLSFCASIPAWKWTVWGGAHAFTVTTLYFAWYQPYTTSRFHFFNDGSEWLQMDKMGHVFSGFWLTRGYASFVHPCEDSLWIGAGMAFLSLSLIEILDGFSAQWGFSLWDMVANLAGISLAVLLPYPSGVGWKWGWKPISYLQKYGDPAVHGKARELFGTSLPVRLLKDYNSQSYWLVIPVARQGFFRYMGIAVGYSAEGMLGGLTNLPAFPGVPRQREWFLSVDIRWDQVGYAVCRNSRGCHTFFRLLNLVRIPFPALAVVYTDEGPEANSWRVTFRPLGW